MAGGPLPGILAAMHGEAITITLQLRVAGESLTGRADDGHGDPRDFSGRLGLLSAIEGLLADHGRDDTEDSRK